MILHPGILALIAGSFIVFIMMLYASILGIRIITRWDIRSSSEEQLTLEKKTYLVSSIIKYALGFEIISGLLYIYTVDDIYRLFVGAMCSTGSLNANPVGWYALYTKIIIFFASSIWIALNNIDLKAEDYPLAKPKYIAMIFITLLVGLDLYFLVSYFSGLRPEIITSCCGSLFSESGTGMAADLAALPPKPMIRLFYITALFFIGTALLCLKYKSGFLRYAITFLAVFSFLVSMASIISFISLYIYEMPSHHCPFDVFQKNYHFIGYPLYISLFCWVFFGLLPGIFQPLKRISSLTEEIERSEKKWLSLGIVFTVVFVCIASWPVIFGNLGL